MKIASILNQSSMPIASPSYPCGPYRFIDREYFTVAYESDPEAIREAVPESLDPDGSHTVLYRVHPYAGQFGFWRLYRVRHRDPL